MNLCDIDQIKALLARHGFRFSKSMGQNFFDPAVGTAGYRLFFWRRLR